MKLTALPTATQLVEQRHKLQAFADAAELGLITMTVGGKHPADSVIAVCRAPFIAECRAQMADIDRQLAKLGLEVD